MKASPNREQLLFLAAGGVILVVIVVVVLFNVMRVPRQVIEEKITPRPMVNMPEKEEPASSAAPADAPWISKRVAPVFENGRKGGEIEVEGYRKEARVEEPPPEADEDPVEVKTSQVVPPGAAKGAESASAKGGAPAKGSLPAAPVAKETKPAEKPVVEKPAEKAEVKAAPEKPARPEPVPPPPPAAAKESAKLPTPAAPGKGGFAVNLGSFADEKNAGSLQGRIAALGLPVYTQKVAVGGKNYFRVRTGPFATREDANDANRMVNQKAGIRGSVVSHGD